MSEPSTVPLHTTHTYLQYVLVINVYVCLYIKDDSPVKEEQITTLVEDWHQLEYETDDIQVCYQH